jgi:hypothetical protein
MKIFCFIAYEFTERYTIYDNSIIDACKRTQMPVLQANPPGIEGESPECRKRSNSGRGLGPKSQPVAAKSSEKLRENGYRNQPTFLNLKQA